MNDKTGGKKPATPDDIMSPAEMKPLLAQAKHNSPVSCAIALTKAKDAVILLDRKRSPKQMGDLLKKQAAAARLDIDATSVRFGRVTTDGDGAAAVLTFAVNKDPPAALRPKLLETMKKAGIAKIDVVVQSALETEPDSPDAITGAAAPPPKTPDQLHALGHQDGLSGRDLAPPADADAAGKLAYNKGYGEGMAERFESDALGAIQHDLKSGDDKDLEKQIDRLSMLSMDAVLDVMAALKKAGQLDTFADRLDAKHTIAGVAVLTIQQELDEQWQALVARLGPAAREAVLKRVPAGSYTGPSTNAKPASALDDDGGGPVTVGVTFVPTTIHAVPGKAGTTSDPPAVQVQGQYTFKFHRDGKGGFEFSPIAQAQFMWDPQNKKLVTQPMLGGQGALVEFLTKTIQIQQFAQLLDGATLEAGKGVSKSITVNASPTEQVAAGIQVVFSFGPHFQLVLLDQLSMTATGRAITVDASAGLGVQWNF